MVYLQIKYVWMRRLVEPNGIKIRKIFITRQKNNKKKQFFEKKWQFGVVQVGIVKFRYRLYVVVSM